MKQIYTDGSGRKWFNFSKYELYIIEQQIESLPKETTNEKILEFLNGLLEQMNGRDIIFELENKIIEYNKTGIVLSEHQYKALMDIFEDYGLEFDTNDPSNQFNYYNEMAHKEIELEARRLESQKSLGTDWKRK